MFGRPGPHERRLGRRSKNTWGTIFRRLLSIRKNCWSFWSEKNPRSSVCGPFGGALQVTRVGVGPFLVSISNTRRAASIESAAQMAAGHGHPLVCGWDDDPGNSGDSGFLQIEPHVHRTVAAGSFPPSSRRVSERRRARSTNQGKRQPPYWLSSCRGSTRKPPSASKCSGSTT
jgi:hypothetical protein